MGEAWLDRCTVADVLTEMSRPAKQELVNGTALQMGSLTKRERDIIKLVSRGYKNKLVAQHLAISDVTVRHHLTSIFSKLELTDRFELIIYAYKNGCIYGQSAEGKKLGMMRANPAVCFEVDHIESVTSWRSVIAWGRFEELHGDAAERATRLLLDRITPLMATTASQRPGRPADAANAASAAVGKQRPVVYRIVLGEKSGRYEQ